MEGELSSVREHNGVPSIITAVKSTDNIVLFRQHIDKAPFTLITPLEPNNYINCHMSLSYHE
mgnify:CR=1 FL=1